MTTTAEPPRSWDLETDVLVVGYGYAGAIAAIEATDSGAEAFIVEKMPHPGGISICSGGGIRTTSNVESCLSYLEHTCGGLTPTSVLRVMAEGMAHMERARHLWLPPSLGGLPVRDPALPPAGLEPGTADEPAVRDGLDRRRQQRPSLHERVPALPARHRPPADAALRRARGDGRALEPPLPSRRGRGLRPPARNQPIPGLYEAGELGGIWGHLYLAGGNLAECYVGGWTAARHAARSERW